MLRQNIPSASAGVGGAAGTGRVMEKLGIVIQLLSNPDELQQRIEDFRARHNATNAMPSAVCQIIRDAIAKRRTCETELKTRLPFYILSVSLSICLSVTPMHLSRQFNCRIRTEREFKVT